MEMTFLDIALTKLAVFLSSCFLIGLLASYWPFQIILFLIQNKWWLLLFALIVAILPMKKFFKGIKPKKKRGKKRLC
jgi:hypothetical protein